MARQTLHSPAGETTTVRPVILLPTFAISTAPHLQTQPQCKDRPHFARANRTSVFTLLARKEKTRYNFTFDEVLINYDLFSNWIEPGLYATQLEKFFALFPKEQILCQQFDTLQEDPKAFLKELLLFLDIETNFHPPVLTEKVNVAGIRQNIFGRAGRKLNEFSRSGHLFGTVLKPVAATATKLNRATNVERLTDVSPETLHALVEICEPETKKLEELLDLDLSHWRRYV